MLSTLKELFDTFLTPAQATPEARDHALNSDG